MVHQYTRSLRDRKDEMHIFLLEDDLEVAESVNRAFDLRGWKVTHATTLAEARALLAVPTGPYDCAVLDLNLPDGKGVELLPLELVEGETLPIAVYSGLPEDAKVEMARRDIDPDSVTVFSKGNPFGLFDWLEAVADPDGEMRAS